MNKVIRGMPPSDHPLAFGQHSNSDMAASIDDSTNMIDVLVSLQPRVVKAVDEEAVDPLAAQCSDLLLQTAEVFSMRAVKEKLDTRSDPDPLKTVLYQELDRFLSTFVLCSLIILTRLNYDRYNSLLSTIRRTLSTIIKVTSGLASITAELEDVMQALGQLKVPKLWGSTYPSQKPLGSWMRDLSARIDFFSGWVDGILKSIQNISEIFV
jgi:dynein heavy chain